MNPYLIILAFIIFSSDLLIGAEIPLNEHLCRIADSSVGKNAVLISAELIEVGRYANDGKFRYDQKSAEVLALEYRSSANKTKTLLVMNDPVNSSWGSAKILHPPSDWRSWLADETANSLWDKCMTPVDSKVGGLKNISDWVCVDSKLLQAIRSSVAPSTNEFLIDFVHRIKLFESSEYENEYFLAMEIGTISSSSHWRGVVIVRCLKVDSAINYDVSISKMPHTYIYRSATYEEIRAEVENSKGAKP